MIKKLIYILLAFIGCNQPEYVYSQVVFEAESGSDHASTDASSYNVAFGHTSGARYIFIVVNTKATTPDIPVPSKTGLSFTQINTVATSTERITAFYVTASTTDAGNATIDFSGNVQTSRSTFFQRISGEHSSSPYPQSPTANSTGVNPSITMSALTNPFSAVMAVFINNTNPFGGTAEAGWDERVDIGGLAPTRGVYIMLRASTTDNTPTVTAASSTWLGMAIEIKAAKQRRVISSN